MMEGEVELHLVLVYKLYKLVIIFKKLIFKDKSFIKLYYYIYKGISKYHEIKEKFKVKLLEQS